MAASLTPFEMVGQTRADWTRGRQHGVHGHFDVFEHAELPRGGSLESLGRAQDRIWFAEPYDTLPYLSLGQSELAEVLTKQ